METLDQRHVHEALYFVVFKTHMHMSKLSGFALGAGILSAYEARRIIDVLDVT